MAAPTPFLTEVEGQVPQRCSFACSKDPAREPARHGGWGSRRPGEADRRAALPRSASPTLPRLRATAASAALVLTAVGCAHAQVPSIPMRTTPPASGLPSRSPDHSSDADPIAVAVAFVSAMGERSYQDPGPTAYLDRAAPYMTLRLSAQLRQQADDNGAVADWNAVRAAQARTVVRVGAATAGPPRTEDSAVVSLTAKYVTRTPGGGRQVSDEHVDLVVVRAGDRWLVDRTNQDEP